MSNPREGFVYATRQDPGRAMLVIFDENRPLAVTAIWARTLRKPSTYSSGSLNRRTVLDAMSHSLPPPCHPGVRIGKFPPGIAAFSSVEGISTRVAYRRGQSLAPMASFRRFSASDAEDLAARRRFDDARELPPDGDLNVPRCNAGPSPFPQGSPFGRRIALISYALSRRTLRLF